MRKVEDTCQDFCCGEVSSWTCQRTSIVLPPCKENNGQCISTIVLQCLLFSNMSFRSVIASRKEVFPCVTIFSEIFGYLCCIKSFCNIHQHYYALQCTHVASLCCMKSFCNIHQYASQCTCVASRGKSPWQWIQTSGTRPVWKNDYYMMRDVVTHRISQSSSSSSLSS